GPMLVAEDGLDGFQVQQRAAAIDQGLEYFFHPPADLEQQGPAVFDLEIRILVSKPAPLLFLHIQSEAQARRVNPTLAGLAQPPYRRFLGQGVCDLRQARGVRNMSKTIPLLGKVDSRFGSLVCHVFMPVDHYLGWKGRMAADLDCDVPPIRIEDVKRI